MDHGETCDYVNFSFLFTFEAAERAHCFMATAMPEGIETNNLRRVDEAIDNWRRA